MCEIIESVATKAREDISVEYIKTVMERLGDSIEKAMEFLKIPESQWEHYKAVLAENS